MSQSWSPYVRPQDFVWLAFFGAIAMFSPTREPLVLLFLFALGAVQVLEPRIGSVASVVLKLALCYPLLYFGGGLASSFYLVLLLPVITAATSFNLWGTAAATFTACALYLSFMAFLESRNQYIPDDQVGELLLRVLFLPVVGFLTNQLAESNRTEAKKLQTTAAELARTNASLTKAEADVRRSDRLAALGQLTAGLAHELRNPLATMRSSAELLRSQVASENEIAKEMAANITEEIDRTGSLINRFLDFARPHSLQREPTDIHTTIDRAIHRFEKTGSRVSVFKNYSPDVLPVAIDSALMEQVLLNLLTNAAQASPPTGSITVKTARARNAIEIAVIDRGSGIEPKHLENIFNPFFTTKSDGVGLGLAIVSKIIEEHGGQISVTSTVGEGSIFVVHLPIGDKL